MCSFKNLEQVDQVTSNPTAYITLLLCRVPFEGESMLDLRNAIVACQYKPVCYHHIACMVCANFLV